MTDYSGKVLKCFPKNVNTHVVFLRCMFLMINRSTEKHFNCGDEV